MGGFNTQLWEAVIIQAQHNKEKSPSKGRRGLLPTEVDILKKKAGLLAPIHPRIVLPVSGGFELVIVTVAGAAGEFHPVPYSLYKLSTFFSACCTSSINRNKCIRQVRISFRRLQKFRHR